MSITANKLFTAEEFFTLPAPSNGVLQELVRGEIIAMPPPGGLHGVCCNKAGRRIGNYVDEHALGHVASNDTGFITGRNPDSVRGSDISFWSRERLPEVPVGYIQIPPDLAVEVLSPSNTSAKIREKIRELFAVGVRMAWVIAPEDRTVTVYRTAEEGRVLHDSATVSGEDVLPGFICRVSDLLP